LGISIAGKGNRWDILEWVDIFEFDGEEAFGDLWDQPEHRGRGQSMSMASEAASQGQIYLPYSGDQAGPLQELSEIKKTCADHGMQGLWG